MASEIPSKTKLYIDTSEKDDLTLEISFLGGDEVGKGNPKLTNVKIRLFKTEAHKSFDLWTRNFGDPAMPTGAWNGFKLVEILSGKIIAAVSNHLVCLNMQDGETEWEIETGNTPIYNILISPRRDQIIVQNGYYKFQHPKGLSNVASFDLNGKEVWRSKLDSDDVFANPPYYEGGDLRASTWNCFNCKIDSSNGKIVDKIFTK